MPAIDDTLPAATSPAAPGERGPDASAFAPAFPATVAAGCLGLLLIVAAAVRHLCRLRRHRRDASEEDTEAGTAPPTSPPDASPHGPAPDVMNSLPLPELDRIAPVVSPGISSAALGDCPVCLEPVAGPRRSLPCGHAFHPPCIEAWMTGTGFDRPAGREMEDARGSQGRVGGFGVCPVCRRVFGAIVCLCPGQAARGVPVGGATVGIGAG
ncbi:hypothetical protein DFJ74DRAFT_712572 [Hyaloraphidium curvatum]|nr:hypothetical protein DFJ74DRAFT_712572 [Hyaloraphidium curvatum]